jgi:hypothetical protein
MHRFMASMQRQRDLVEPFCRRRTEKARNVAGFFFSRPSFGCRFKHVNSTISNPNREKSREP